MKSYEEIFEEIIIYQKAKLLKLVKEILPNIVEDDLMQPFDFPELERHPDFRYEEGVLEGLLTAAMALRSHRIEIIADEITCLK